MKRILSLVLILILSVGILTACELPGIFPTTTPTTTTPTTPAHNCEYDAESAKDFLASMYVGWLDNNATPSGFSVLAQMLSNGTKYLVEWTVDNEAVTLAPSADGTEIIVTVPERGAEDLVYTLTGTVIAPDGCEAELSYELCVPAFAINSYDDYATAEKGALLTVKGVITGIVKKADGWSSNSVYFQCENGGYYAYNVSDDAIANLQVGMTILASGEYDLYNGTHELMKATFTVVDETITTVTPVDLTEAFLNASDLDAKELVYAQAFLVTLKGVEITSQNASNGYLNFKLGNFESYLRISSSNNVPSKEVTEAIKAAHAEHFGWKADVTGLVSVYNGKFYLIPVDGNAFSNWVEVEKTPEQKVDAEKGSLSIDSSYSADGTYPLPLAGKNYSDVVISWASNNELVVINEDGTMTVKVPDDKTEVTLTATLTCGEATATAELKITLNKTLTSIKDANEIASSKEHNTYTEDKYLVGGVITEIASDKYGNLYFTDGVETFYVYGLYDVDGNRYDAMATKPAVGDYIVVLTALGQYNGTAQGKNATLISISNPKDIPSANEMASAQEHNTYTADKYVITGTIDEIVSDKYGNVYIVDEAGNRFYVYGLYDIAGNRYDGMAVKPAVGDVITVLTALGQYNGAAQGKNATVVAHTPKAAEEPSDPVDPNPEEPNPEDPTDEKAYIFGMTQGNLENKIYYLAGGMDGYYMATTTDASAALKVYLEATEGGYYFYCYVDGAKTYINMVVSGTHVNGAYESAPSTVHTLDSEKNTLIATVNDTEYWYATRNDKTYTTMGPCAVSYEGFYGVLYPVDGEVTPPAGGDNEGGETNNDPAADSTLTVEQAIALGSSKEHDTYTSGKYYVTGVITEVYNTTYGNMKIKDEAGNIITVYGTYDATGANRYDAMATKPVAGDTVTVYGIIGQYNGTAQLKNAWITAHTPAEGGEEGGEEGGNEGTVTPPATSGSYVQVTDASQFTSGTYVLMAGNHAATVVSDANSPWLLKDDTLTVTDGVITDAKGAVIILTISGSSVTMKDANGNFIAPKGGNNNGIKKAEYSWNWSFNADGTVVFTGINSDTVTLAYNQGSNGGNFRGYKNTTVSGDYAADYLINFTVYKLVD